VIHDTRNRPLGSLRVSVTDRCNLRCRYCMPEEDYVWLPRTSLLTFEEIARLTRVFTKLGVTKLRGQWKLYRGHTLVMPTYHPSYLLRPSPQQVEAKRQAWQDLQLVMKELGLAPPLAKKPTE